MAFLACYAQVTMQRYWHVYIHERTYDTLDVTASLSMATASIEFSVTDLQLEQRRDWSQLESGMCCDQ